MIKNLILILFSLVLFAKDIIISSGSKDGTYYKIVDDLSKIYKIKNI